jgi:hypothetical protein
MNRLFFILPILFLTACTGDSDLVQGGKLVFNSVTGSAAKISRERAAAVPYATMGLELGSSAQGLLILGTTMGNELDWFAGETVFVATNHGRVIRTVGLPFDLGGIRPSIAPSLRKTPSVGAISSSSAMDFPDLGIFGAPAQCSSRTIGDESVEILGASILTRHVVEHCEVSVLKWKFDNDFWEDRTSGYVWRSRQYIHPKSPPIILEVLRPEQSPAN